MGRVGRLKGMLGRNRWRSADFVSSTGLAKEWRDMRCLYAACEGSSWFRAEREATSAACYTQCACAGVAELVDAGDLKSPARKSVRVRVPPPASRAAKL